MVKLFISNKTNRKESDIILTENNNVIKERKNAADILNKYVINIAEYIVRNRITALPSKDIEISQAINLGVKCQKTCGN